MGEAKLQSARLEPDQDFLYIESVSRERDVCMSHEMRYIEDVIVNRNLVWRRMRLSDVIQVN